MAKSWKASPVLLKAFDTFNALDGDGLGLLAENSEIREFKRGQIAISEGQSPEWVFYILYGAVVLLKKLNGTNHANGEKPEVAIQVYGPGDAIADQCIYMTYEFKGSVRALSECQVLAIKRDALSEVALRYPSVLLSLYNRASDKFLRMIDGVDLSAGNLVDRIQCLANACHSVGVELTKEVSKAEIARMLGVSRVAVSQAMNKNKALFIGGHTTSPRI